MQFYYQDKVESILKTSIYRIHKKNDYASKFSFTNYEFLRVFLQTQRSNELKEFLSDLLKNKTYEILSSSIAMPDQAVTYFDDLNNNMEYGREYGLKHFGQVSRYGWAIDNFGQSAFTVRFHAEVGYDSFTTVRLPALEKSRLIMTSNLHFHWGNKYPEFDILTHVFPLHYNPPSPLHGFEDLRHEQITSLDWNLFHSVNEAFKIIRNTYQHFREVNVLTGMGDDFKFVNFPQSIDSIKKIYAILKSNSKSLYANSTFVVSTVDEYFRALREENYT
jgi:hypothetical protein